jgi:serine/threonine-protein kinase RsbW
MIWVGNFKSLQAALCKPRLTDAPMELHTWLGTEIALISPLVDWLISLITESRCVPGNEEYVEFALREAVSNAMLHGNCMDPRKLVHVRCCCKETEGVFIVVRDQGRGFDPQKVADPLAVENLGAEHGRGILLMKWAMDEVSFKRRGAEVQMRKASGNEPKTAPQRIENRTVRRHVIRPEPGVRVVEFGRRPIA